MSLGVAAEAMPRIARASLLALVLLAYCWPASAAALVNINTADAATLDTLPGIGPTKAAAIVSYREAHGSFKTTENIEEVSGIGPATYAKLATFISVSGAPTPVPSMQPQSKTKSSPTVRESIISPNAPAHAVQTVSAPAATTTVAAAGAALPAPTEVAPATMSPTASRGLFHSTWAIGLLAVLGFAGGAFMIL